MKKQRRKLSEEHKRKISEAMKNSGYKHSEETKAKQSAAKLGKKRKPFSLMWRYKLHLSNKKTYARKLKEAKLAKKLEKQQEKETVSESSNLTGTLALNECNVGLNPTSETNTNQGVITNGEETN